MSIQSDGSCRVQWFFIGLPIMFSNSVSVTVIVLVGDFQSQLFCTICILNACRRYIMHCWIFARWIRSFKQRRFVWKYINLEIYKFDTIASHSIPDHTSPNPTRPHHTTSHLTKPHHTMYLIFCSLFFKGRREVCSDVWPPANVGQTFSWVLVLGS